MDFHKLTKQILVAHRKSLMDEPKQILEEELVPQDMPLLENASLYFELDAKRNPKILS